MWYLVSLCPASHLSVYKARGEAVPTVWKDYHKREDQHSLSVWKSIAEFMVMSLEGSFLSCSHLQSKAFSLGPILAGETGEVSPGHQTPTLHNEAGINLVIDLVSKASIASRQNEIEWT